MCAEGGAVQALRGSNSPCLRTGKVSAPKGRILVIEDELAVARVLVDSLRLFRYTAQSVDNAAAALKLLDNQEEFDVVISDIRLPDQDGTQLLRALIRRRPAWQQRFIAITGDTGLVSESGYSDQLGVRCLTKPFRLPELLRQVEETMDYATSIES
ncbi:MAG TPA: response regulator [Armatimonadota bacterium]|nr:response regulator [Armatimonadota bacterium]